MFLSRLRRKFFRKKGELLAVIDVGSSLMKISIINKSTKKILYFLDYKPKYNPNIFDNFSVFSKNICKILNKGEDKFGFYIEEVVFGFNKDDNFLKNPLLSEKIQKLSKILGVKSLGYFNIAKSYFDIQENKNYIVLDIGSGGTSIVLIKDGYFVQSEYFDIGGDFFTKKISKKLEISFEKAEREKIIFSIGGNSQNIFGNDFSHQIEAFITGFFVGLMNMKQESFPNKIFLCGSGSLFCPIREGLRDQKLPYEKLNFIDFPDVSLIEDDDLKRIFGSKESLYVPYIPIKIFSDFVIKNIL